MSQTNKEKKRQEEFERFLYYITNNQGILLRYDNEDYPEDPKNLLHKFRSSDKMLSGFQQFKFINKTLPFMFIGIENQITTKLGAYEMRLTGFIYNKYVLDVYATLLHGKDLYAVSLGDLFTYFKIM